MMRHACIFGFCLALVGCGSTTQDPSEILRVSADRVVDRDGSPVWLRGLQFTNWAYRDPADPQARMPYADQSDYQRAHAMGVNTIAFFLRSDQFEVDAAPYEYQESGFAWLDQNIAWAKASGIRLVLSLASTPGTAQWQTPCDGNSVWDVPEYQERTIALWQALARRYADEPVIAGYDPLAFPITSGPKEQWQVLATRLVSAIRAVDRQHIVVIDASEGAFCQYAASLSAADLFRVPDPNVLYAFETDYPWDYIAQLLPSQGLGDGGAYPDDNRLIAFDADDLEWQHATWDSMPQQSELALRPDQTDWTEQRFAYRVTNPDYQIAVPELQSDHNLGKVYFDDFTVNEYDPDANFVRTVMNVDIEDASPWYFYQGYDDGSECHDCGGVVALESDAHQGHASISISGTTSGSNLSNGGLAFPTRLNYIYEMRGWIKGQNSTPKSASAFRLDLWKVRNDGALPLRNRDSLARHLQAFVDWGKEQRVPLYVNEFFAGRPTFSNDKGGLRWVEDMIGLFRANDCHFAYDEYRGDDSGIYTAAGDPADPAVANQPLIDLLTRELTR
jgi:endoglucanase